MEHTETWEQNHKRGVRYQDYVMKRLIRDGIIVQCFSSKEAQLSMGESIQGIEIKEDTRWSETKRLSIEVAEKSHPDNPHWVPSGIYARPTPWLYIQGDDSKFFVLPGKMLRAMHQSGDFEESEKFGTIKTFYIPLGMAEEIDLFPPEHWSWPR